MNLILLVLTVTQATLCIMALTIANNQEKSTKDTLDLCTRIIDEREKIMKIILFADLTKEHYFTTLEKIKKELDMPSKRI